jgi:hypothetical protein
VMDVGAALDFVLRRAVLRNDDAIIEAYRDIWQARKSHAGKDIRAALRLGLLLGAELNRNQTVGKAPKEAVLNSLKKPRRCQTNG